MNPEIATRVKDQVGRGYGGLWSDWNNDLDKTTKENF